jgi:SAM-dependent methyltransferase
MSDRHEVSSAPEHADPERYVELAGFDGDWRERWWNADFLALHGVRWRLGEARRVLDVGAGAGHWGRTLLPQLSDAVKLTGVDREPAFCELARAAAAARGLAERCTYVEGTAEALPFEDGSFDLVTCQTVLIHVADAAAVVREMVRVTAPGGLVLCSEPDNFATAASLLGDSLDLPREDLLDLLRLQRTCEDGKMALREGDERVGAKLPGIFAAAGLVDIDVRGNDKCAWLVPPYATSDQKVDLRVTLGWADEGAWHTGTEHDSRRNFLAGGGTHEDFDRLWPKTGAWWAAFREAVAAGTYHAGRSVVHYLVAGRKR